MNQKVHVLFVCAKNTSRSPMAAAYFKKLCTDRGLDHIYVESAGIATGGGEMMDDKAVEVLNEHKATPLRLLSQRLVWNMIARSTLIFGMTKRDCERIVDRFDKCDRKVRRLMGLVDSDRDVPDPYGSDLKNYQHCFDIMKPALEELAERLA